MPDIGPIQDSYIDSVIKSNQASNPDASKTQGTGLRQLVKDLRDHLETEIASPATETSLGAIEIATIADALARTDDHKAMTALKSISLILDEKKNVSYQINPVSLTEVSVYMENAGKVNSLIIAGATGAKLKIGQSGTYPSGSQTYPFSYSAGDRVFITYSYTDLTNASCNIKLKCKDN